MASAVLQSNDHHSSDSPIVITKSRVLKKYIPHIVLLYLFPGDIGVKLNVKIVKINFMS